MKYFAKKGLIIATLAVFAASCADNTKVIEKLDAIEKKLAELEKRPAAPAKPGAPAVQTSAYKLPIGDSPVLGDKDAKVTVTVFSDMQCPYCAKVDPILTKLVEDKDLKGKVNLVFKHFPLSFHKNAKPAAKAALAAAEQGKDKFWEMTEKMFENYRTLTPENFKKWAKEIGLDVAKFEADLKNNDAKYEAAIKADMDLGQKTANVRGTPSIFVGGWSLPGSKRTVDGIKDFMKEKKLLSLD